MTNATETSTETTASPITATSHVSSSAPTGAAPFAPVRTLSIIALALGAASVLFGYTFLVPIAAIVVGILGYQREPEARVMSVWGIVLGAVMSVGWVFLGFIGLAAAAPWFLFSL